jgi:outer membrane protein assembly factor BamB
MRLKPALAALLLAGGLPVAATQVKIFETQNQAGFLAGKLAGVSVDALVRMSLAPRAVRLASITEPFLLSAAVTPHGWVVGTGNAGKVLAIDPKGVVHELLGTAEPEVFAVLADADGTVFAGSSPHGKVYRITPDGKSSVFYDPGETYIWALARGADGALLVATGTQGKLFRVDAKGRGELLFKSEDTHLRSLLVLPGGDVLIGTAGQGLILKLGRDGKVSTLFEAEEPEVVALTAAPDGSCYAAVDASEASILDLAKEPAAAGAGQGLSLNAPGGTGPRSPQGRAASAAAQEAAGEVAAGSRRPGTTGPRSEVLRISPQGTVESLWSFTTETVYSLLWQAGRLWVATGLEGKLYSWADANLQLEKDVEERQIVALLAGTAGPAFATTNAAAFYRITAGSEKHGTYTSAALDAGQVASFGTFRWRGEVPEGGALTFAFRSGFSTQPDRTWSAWISPAAAEESQPGGDGSQVPPAGQPAQAAPASHELPLTALPKGRFVQWRAELKAGSASPLIYGIELSYRQQNLRPKITAFQALEPGQILVPINFNPGNQVYEPAHTTRDGIFTSLEPAMPEESGRLKTLWKKGYQTLRWTASDANEDPLVYDLYFRTAVAGREGSRWLKMATGVEEDHYSFDAMALPDGVYRFRLVASDRLANDAASALAAERVSDPVVIDHTPPALVSVTRDGRQLRVKLHDDASPIREAVYSIDGGEWKPARPADGLLDAQTETVLIDLSDPAAAPPGAPANLPSPSPPRGPGAPDSPPASLNSPTALNAAVHPLVLLRVTDAAYNVIAYDLSSQAP